MKYEFYKNFSRYFDAFITRYNRFCYIRNEWYKTRDKGIGIDYNVYIDILVVHIRSLCLENDKLNKKNYTIYKFLELANRKDLIDKLNIALDENFIDDEDYTCSIRTILKKCSDKYICHHDNIDFFDFVDIETTFLRLSNPYFYNNFDAIIKKIVYIVEDAMKTVTFDFAEDSNSNGQAQDAHPGHDAE